MEIVGPWAHFAGNRIAQAVVKHVGWA